MLNDLKKGDNVITIGGIHGSISGFKGKEKKAVIIKVDKNTSMTINRSAIAGMSDKVWILGPCALEGRDFFFECTREIISIMGDRDWYMKASFDSSKPGTFCLLHSEWL